MRSIDAAMLSELSASVVRPRLFVEIELISTTLRFWTGEFDITWNSVVWQSSGVLKAVSPLSERSGKPEGFKIDLAGETSSVLSVILSDLQRGKSGKIYFGFVTEANAVIATPIVWTGKLDSCELRDGVASATATLNYEDALVRLGESKNLRYNQETQKVFYTNDLGFEYAEQVEDFAGYWGKSKRKERKKDRKK